MVKLDFSDLENKVCAVTGGAGIIGSELATALARYGARVAILDLNKERAVKKADEIRRLTQGTVIGIVSNVLDKESLIAAAENINSTWGPVDILINGAGGNSPKATTKTEKIGDEILGNLDDTFFGLDLEGFKSVFDLNFTGTLLPSMVFGRGMVEQKHGVVLNISSMNSFRPLTRIPAYSAAKASINNFTAWLAVHLAPQNIRVNAIAPGFLLTGQNRFLLTDEKTGLLSARGGKIIAATPMGRFGTPDELTGAALYLISDLSRFVTGVVLPIDGGFSAYSGV
jgi:NAD(P)-dependent dehydrogenase (short-subunit alcohol dehydrogenase family)